MDELDKKILMDLQDDFPLTKRPFKSIADRLGVAEEEVIDRIKRLKEQGIVRRLSASIRHRELGITANAMVVLKVPEDKVEEIGKKLASLKEVTHCYERRIIPGKWEYNLFFVVHCREREECDKLVKKICESMGIKEYKLIYSTKEYKKTYRRLGK